MMPYASLMFHVHIDKDKSSHTMAEPAFGAVLGHNHWYMISSPDITIGQCVEAKQLSYPSKQLQQ